MVLRGEEKERKIVPEEQGEGNITKKGQKTKNKKRGPKIKND